MTENEGMLPPPPPPNLPPETILETPGSSRRPAAYIAVVVGLLAMVGGAVFFARSLGTAEGGADTPVAAVQRMFDAIADEDALGVLETMLPSERDQLRGSLQDITKELSRLGILSNDLDLGSIPGIELDFTGLTFSSQQIASGISTVRLETGTSTYKVDPARSPIGEFLRPLLDDGASEVVQGTDDLSDDDVAFTTVEEGDKWFVSLWYSIAEAARQEVGAPVPPFGNGIAARGAPTPEQAVEEMIRAAVLLDVRRMIELTPPIEARALHDYAPLFIDQAVAGAREARKLYEVEVSKLNLTGRVSGNTALVKVGEIEFTAAIPAMGVSVEYDGECVTVRGDFFGSDEPQRQCGAGFAPATGLPVVPTPEIGFVAVREGGLWYVSPTRTVLDGLLGTLKVLDRNALEMFKKVFGGLSGG
ncbi:MAG: hypothetical protein WEB06_08280 [Actinomycetota bacterium]